MKAFLAIIFASLCATTSFGESQNSQINLEKYSIEFGFTKNTRDSGIVTDADLDHILKLQIRYSGRYPETQDKLKLLDLNSDEGKKEFRNNILLSIDAAKTFKNRYIIPAHLRSQKQRELILNFNYHGHSNMSAVDNIIYMSPNFAELGTKTYLTKDVLLFILCHEAAHNNGTHKEGYADHKAVTGCLNSIFYPEENEEFVKENIISSDIAEICQRRYTEKDELNLCYRIISMGIRFAHFINENKNNLENSNNKVDLLTPDTSIYAGGIKQKHPEPQCRLDTIVRAALNIGAPPCFDGSRVNYEYQKVESEFEIIYGKKIKLQLAMN